MYADGNDIIGSAQRDATNAFIVIESEYASRIFGYSRQL